MVTVLQCRQLTERPSAPSYCTQNKRSRLEEFAKSASNTTFGKLAGLWGNQQRERYTIEKPLPHL